MKETLTNEELVALIQNGENVSENMGLLYEQNKGMIYKTVKPFATNTVDIDDLMQEAYFALDKAAKNFDLSSGYKFTTYLIPTVYGLIQRGLMRDSQIGLTVNHRRRIRKYHGFMNQYISEHGVEPSDKEIIAALGWLQSSLDDLREIMRQSAIGSLDVTIPGDSQNPDTFGDFIADPEANIEENYIEQEEKRERMQAGRELWEYVDSLGERKAYVIRERCCNQKTLEEVGCNLGISGEGVRQIEKRTIESLRKSPKVKELADRYGYKVWANSSKAYRGSIKKFKETGTSITEHLALKSVEEKQRLAIGGINLLPDGCIEKIVLQRHYFEKMTINEIAAELGMCSRSVKRIQKRGQAIIYQMVKN